MAKIFYNGNRIIVDGHAETAEECRAITAMCDSMANNENFKTIVYEEGHAVFEQISGGESELFAAINDYLLAERYNSETGYSSSELATKGTIKRRLDVLEADYTAVNTQLNEQADPTKVGSLAYQIAQLTEQLAALLAKPEYKLPYTAAEIEAKLANL